MIDNRSRSLQMATATSVTNKKKTIIFYPLPAIRTGEKQKDAKKRERPKNYFREKEYIFL